MRIDLTHDAARSQTTTAALSTNENREQPGLTAARQRAREEGLAFAGAIDPVSAYEILAADMAVLVDVRTIEERQLEGYVPHSLHVPWKTGAAMLKNPRFLKDLGTKVPREAIVLFICRSGKRSADAAAAAAKGGYAAAFNVLEGVDGDADTQEHAAGWRLRGLPWVQD